MSKRIKKNWIVAVFTLVILLSTVALYSQSRESSREKWEYEVVRIDLDHITNPNDRNEAMDQLNSYGEQGWELVVIDKEMYNKYSYWHAVFKRRKN